MNCELFEELIPLHVGGDLEPLEADRLRQHLNSCAHCRRLNEEFQASQNWLTGFAVPKFDEASFANLRTSVLDQIERQEKRGSWIQWLLPKWSPRQGWGPGLMLASAAVALAITTGLIAAVYRQQIAPAKPSGDTLAGNSNQINPGKGYEPTGNAGSINSGSEQVSALINSRKRTLRSKRADTELLPPEAFTNGGFQQPLEPPVIPEESVEQAIPPTEPVEKEMLRMEIQTADPNIRIIWLTPKESGSPTNKPSAQTR